MFNNKLLNLICVSCFLLFTFLYFFIFLSTFNCSSSKLNGFNKKSSAPSFKTSIFVSFPLLAETAIIGTSLTSLTFFIISSPDIPGNIKSKIIQHISLSVFNLSNPSVPEND